MDLGFRLRDDMRRTLNSCFSVDQDDRRPVRRISTLVCREMTSQLESRAPDVCERRMIVLGSKAFDLVRAWSATDWLDARSEEEHETWVSLFRVEDLVVQPLDEASFWLHFELRCSQPLLANVAPVLICSRTTGDFVRWSKEKHLLFPVEFQRIIMAMFAAYHFGSLGILGHDLIYHVCSYLPMAWPTPCCGWFHDRKCRGGYISSDGAELDCNSVLEKIPLGRLFYEGEPMEEAVCRYHFDQGFVEPMCIRSPWYGQKNLLNHCMGAVTVRKYVWFSLLWLAPYADGSLMHDSNSRDVESSLVQDEAANNVTGKCIFVPEMLVSLIGTNRIGVVLGVVTGGAVEVSFFDNEKAHVMPEQLAFVPPTSVGEEVFSKQGNRAVILLIRMNQAIIELNDGESEVDEDGGKQFCTHCVHMRTLSRFQDLAQKKKTLEILLLESDDMIDVTCLFWTVLTLSKQLSKHFISYIITQNIRSLAR